MMLNLWVKNVEFASEQCSVFEWMMLSFWVNNVDSMSERCSIFEWIILSFEWTMLTLWVNNFEIANDQCWLYGWKTNIIQVNTISGTSEQCSVFGWILLSFEWTMLSLQVNNVHFLSEWYPVFESAVFEWMMQKLFNF